MTKLMLDICFLTDVNCTARNECGDSLCMNGGTCSDDNWSIESSFNCSCMQGKLYCYWIFRVDNCLN